jgi:hypothetical protein
MTLRSAVRWLSGLSIAAGVGLFIVRMSTVDSDGLRPFPLPLSGAVALVLVIALTGALNLMIDDERPALIPGVAISLVAALLLSGSLFIVLPVATLALLSVGVLRTGRP